MTKLSIFQWIAIAVIFVAVAVEIVLVFKAPAAAVYSAIAFVLGLISGYWLKKNNIVNK